MNIPQAYLLQFLHYFLIHLAIEAFSYNANLELITTTKHFTHLSEGNSVWLTSLPLLNHPHFIVTWLALLYILGITQPPVSPSGPKFLIVHLNCSHITYPPISISNGDTSKGHMSSIIQRWTHIQVWPTIHPTFIRIYWYHGCLHIYATLWCYHMALGSLLFTK